MPDPSDECRDEEGVAPALEGERDFVDALLDTLSALVCIIDREGRIIRFNRVCETMSGFTIDEVKRRPFWELLIPPEEIDGVREVVRFLVEEKKPNQWENRWIAKDGSERWIHWSNTVLCDERGELEFIIGTGIDVTERKRAEAERDRLFAEEQRAREQAEQAEQRAMFLAGAGRALAGSLDYAETLAKLARLAVPCLAGWCAVRVIDEDGIVRTPAYAHVDPALEAVIAEHIAEAFDLPVEAAFNPTLREGKSLLLNGGAACFDRIVAEFPNVSGAVEARGRDLLRLVGMTSCMAVPLLARGRFLGAMFFGSIDDRNEFGPEHLELAEALASRAAMALDNARLYREAQRATQAREEFLMVASHELRTPLTSLQLAVQALAQRERDAPTSSAPLLRAVERSAARLTALVDDLLDISMLTGEPLVPALGDVDLAGVVAQVVGAMESRAKEAGCAITVTARGPTNGVWDRRWLVRVVTNLVENATKYGRGEPIAIELAGSEERALLTVRDHGIGIAPAEAARIFDRFERAVSVRHYGGFGLGLWVARRMVEALGGTVRVESRLGDGATFTVDLPRRATIP
jgi:PAS domain S-box-containing protein